MYMSNATPTKVVKADKLVLCIADLPVLIVVIEKRPLPKKGLLRLLT